MEIMTCALVMNKMIGLRNIELTADQRFDSGLIGLGIELQGSVHGPVVGDCHSVHAVGLGLSNQVSETNGPVEHGVLGVDVEMDKGCGHSQRINLFFFSYAVRLSQRPQPLFDRMSKARPIWRVVNCIF